MRACVCWLLTRGPSAKFPSLVTCCTIDWFTEWPAEALAGVAHEAFAEIEFPSDEVKAGIVSLCRDIHQAETPLLPCAQKTAAVLHADTCLLHQR